MGFESGKGERGYLRNKSAFSPSVKPQPVCRIANVMYTTSPVPHSGADVVSFPLLRDGT